MGVDPGMEEPETELLPAELETRGLLEVVEVDLEEDTAPVDEELDTVDVVVELLLGASVMLGYAEYIRRPALNVELALRPVMVSFR